MLAEFSMWLEVTDRMELYKAARARFLRDNLGNENEADQVLLPEGDVDVGRCLQMVLDPGDSPDGTKILETSCETSGEWEQ